MNSSKSIISNYIIYGDDFEELAPDFVHFERMEISKRKHQGDIKPHIHSNIFQIYFIGNGSIEFTSNDFNDTIGMNSFVLIPENTLHGVQLNEDTTGMVLTLSQLLVESLFENDPAFFLAINKLQVFDVKSDPDFIKSVVDKIEHELFDRRDAHDQMINALLTIMFTNIYRGIKTKTGIDSRMPIDVSHFSKFQRLIKLNGTTEKTLQEYAREVGITTTHLNRICKATVGKRASEVIKDYIILEAKRHLKFSSHTISEIAYLLQFSNPSYFNKYFKKEVGLTPRAYRLAG